MSTTGWIVLGVFILSFAAGFWLLYVKLMGKSFLPKSTSIPSFGNKGWLLIGAAGLGGIVWWFFWDILSGSLWWRVAPLVLIAIICFRWAKSKDKSLPANIGNAALIALAVVLLVSAPGRIFGGWFDSQANAVAEGGISSLTDGLVCPGTFSVSDKVIVHRGCTAEIRGTIPAGSNLIAMDGDFDGLLTQYVDIEQPFPGFVTLKPNKGFPAGKDKVEVRVVS
jgi:hypothetical protein